MKVLIDIAHPAHIHYFRNFSKLFEQKGHQCLFTLRNKGIILELAEHYKLNFTVRSKEGRSKLFYMLSAIKNIFLIARKFKPDVFIDMGTVVASPVAKILRKPYIAFDDTEASVKARALHMPFTDVVLTPSTFYIDLGRKHIRFNSLMEMMYLHENYFSSDNKLLMPYIKNPSNYVLIRFVSWEAHHDIGKKGISYSKKIELIAYLEEKYEVIISAEGVLPIQFEKYRMKAPSYMIHHAIANARLVITEGATMASEAVILGVPTVYINTIQNGYSLEQKNSDLLFSLSEDHNLMSEIMKAEQIIENENMLAKFKLSIKNYKASKINCTEFLIWFVENYPQSVQIMRENPDYQLWFK
ncbi:MAG: DUF354 domain-containing protein [Bacteroidales bacterium]|nr:DUF354 domain-containing protein [Bacteroidales bacterium]